MARTLKKIFVTVVLMTMSLPALADGQSSGNSNPPANGSAVLKQQSRDPLTKRIPSGLSMEVIYENGILTLTSNHYTGAFSLSFENYETGETYAVPSIQIGESTPLILEIGEYELTVTGEDGTELIGFMQIY